MAIKCIRFVISEYNEYFLDVKFAKHTGHIHKSQRDKDDSREHVPT